MSIRILHPAVRHTLPRRRESGGWRVLGWVVLVAGSTTFISSAAEVRLERLPNGGVQPQIAMETDGTAHLVWLEGDASAADIMYQRRPLSAGSLAVPVRVNSLPGSAIAMGTVRGAQIALDSKGTPHIVWVGSKTSATQSAPGAPLLYSRFLSKKNEFEPQRNLLGQTSSLDGGGTLAVGPNDHVSIVWHARGRDASPDESHRQIFLALSKDDGERFQPERVISPSSGACGCCGMAAATAADGSIHILYRSANPITQRGLTWLHSTNSEGRFSSQVLQEWETSQCPMSTCAVRASKSTTWLAWETRGAIYVSKLLNGSDPVSQPQLVSDSKGSKHPSLTVNPQGQILVTWTEGTGWNRGGKLAWRLLDPDGKPSSAKAIQTGIPAWGYAAAYFDLKGNFVILY